MAHKWHFFVAGGVKQVAIRSGADILALPELDQKLWVALAMPTKEVGIDPATLDILDPDKDGRIRAADIVEISKWVGASFKSADDLIKGGDAVPLANIKDPTIAAAAKRILSDLGKKDATSISVGEVGDVVKAFKDTILNGDGIIIPDSAKDDADLKSAIEQALDTVGSVADRSGKPGVDQAKLDAFFGDVDKLAAWAKAGPKPLGDDTAAAADALAAVKAKIEDYFARCALAAFDSRAAAGVNGQEADFIALGAKALTAGSDDIAKLPLARVEAGRALPLRGAVNPAWAAQLAAFADKAVKPVVGARDTLTVDDFHKVVDKLGAVLAWRGDKPASPVAKLDGARVESLATGKQRAALAALVTSDKALEGEYAAISSVDKLVRLQRDFARILRNFVNFSEFYDEAHSVSAFQCGSLYLDGRAFHLSVPVLDAGKHGAMAAMASTYLAYCDLKRAGASKTVAVAVTNGDADNIFVGRNGIFYDAAGNDWDATITKIISNPISIREAFFSPYKKLVRAIEEQVGKRAAEAEAKANSKIDSAATAVATVDKKDGAAPPKKGLDIGVIALLSVAIGAVMGAIAAMVGGIAKLGIWAPFGILGLLMVISGPSMLLAWMKLRQRNLGPILDANGWAVNVKARINVALGTKMTDLAALPPGSTVSLNDPLADKQRPWKAYIAIAVVVILGLSWWQGRLDGLLPVDAIKSTKVMGCSSPKWQRDFGSKEMCKAALKKLAEETSSSTTSK